MKKLMSLFWVTCICTAMIGCGGGSDSAAPATEAGVEAAAESTEEAAGSGTTEEAPAEEAPAEEEAGN